jgi:hypothetical protein
VQLSSRINEHLDSPSELMKAAVILRTVLEVFSKKTGGSEMRLFSTGPSPISPRSLDPSPCPLLSSSSLSGLNQSVHLSFQNDKSFCGLAALYSLSLLLLSRALEGIPYALFEIQEGSTASLRIDISEFSSQVTPTLASHPYHHPHLSLLPLLIHAYRRFVCCSWSSSAGTLIPLPPCQSSPFFPFLSLCSSSIFYSSFCRGNDESNLVAHGYEQLSVKLPSDWVTIAGGPQAFEAMLQSSIACYLKLRNSDLFSDRGTVSFRFDPPAAALVARVIKDYLFSFRQFLLALVSIASSNSAAFPSDSQRISHVSSVLETLTPLLRDNIFASLRNYQPQGYPSLPKSFFVELRHQEFEHVIFILTRVFGLSPSPFLSPPFLSLPPTFCLSDTFQGTSIWR